VTPATIMVVLARPGPIRNAPAQEPLAAPIAVTCLVGPASMASAAGELVRTIGWWPASTLDVTLARLLFIAPYLEQ
jgi:hypothetical protein